MLALTSMRSLHLGQKVGILFILTTFVDTLMNILSL